MRVALRSLDDLEVATPCSADWASMAGDDVVRFCPQCRQNVYNISGMTADEATALLGDKDRLRCVRFYRRRDGTVMTADCPIGIRQLVRHPWRWTLALIAAVFAVMVGLASSSPGRSFVRRLTDSVLGAVAPSYFGSSCSTATMGDPLPAPTAGKPSFPPRNAPAEHPPQHPESNRWR
jgi:hypothetical protein